MKKKLVILTGPTAVGKTELSIKLAKNINGEIISADSIQVYKHMDIGSAKIMPCEMQGINHHLIDILEPYEDFNIVLFKKLASEAIADITARGKIPIITGGTGFYIQAVIKDICFDDTVDDGYRVKLEELVSEQGPEYLHSMLMQCDPSSAQSIHYNNVKRVIRALEYFHQTGKPISEHNEIWQTANSPYNYAYFVLNNDRQILYERINKRIDNMIDNGLIEEVNSLITNYHLNSENVSMQGLGYKEILSYLSGHMSLEEAVYILKRDTRHFAKRQITWFKRENDVIWLDKSQNTEEKILDDIIDTLREKNIL